ncbi:hypothetical protein FHS90_003113 [Rufibacter quisquiliarum]|uniref:Uncharacterized protein n=1 Tax=Rufibacter quisquiliarum TaxID=1549639 RepID=A0A839GU36_9BACT|nr:hypothetical protein [Rufibacter quisquiliarum]
MKTIKSFLQKVAFQVLVYRLHSFYSPFKLH